MITIADIQKNDRGLNQFYRSKQVAKMLGCSQSTIYHYVKSGLLNAPTKLSPKVAVWSDEDIREFIERAKEVSLNVAITDIQENHNDPYDFVKSEIRELLEKALWGDEDATLYGQINSGGLDMIKLMELKAQMATISANIERLTGVIENPKVKLGEEIEDFSLDL